MYSLKTEDGINIRKLYIKINDKSINLKDISSLLSIYGSIEEIRLNTGSRRCRMRNRGFITYTRSYNATKALLQRKNFQEYFSLYAADTWLQPDYNFNEMHFSSELLTINSNTQIFSILDDDSILHVMSFLDPIDVFTLKKVCLKFYELVDFYFRSIRTLNFINMKGKNKITMLEAKMICEKVGKNVLKLYINSEKFNSQRILNFIPKYFLNLKYLCLIGFNLDDESFWQQMKIILKRIDILDLSDNSFIHEDFLNCFQNSKGNLKCLNVSNSNVSSDFLENIKFLQHLNISGCRNINGRQLIPYTKANCNLISLNIGKCPNIYGKALNEILTNAQQLQSLTLNNYYIDEDTSRFVIPNINSMVNLKELSIQNINYPPCDQLLRTVNLENNIEILNISYGNLTLTTVYAVSTMKYLKKFIMNFKTSVSDDLIDYIVDKTKLEEIHIAACSYISPENILRLFQIKTLKFLDISRCYGFSNDFIFEVIKLIKSTLPREVFTMIVGQTDIDHTIMNDPLMIASRKYLHLKWNITKDIEHDYDIDEENNKTENQNQQECYNLDGENKNI